MRVRRRAPCSAAPQGSRPGGRAGCPGHLDGAGGRFSEAARRMPGAIVARRGAVRRAGQWASRRTRTARAVAPAGGPGGCTARSAGAAQRSKCGSTRWRSVQAAGAQGSGLRCAARTGLMPGTLHAPAVCSAGVLDWRSSAVRLRPLAGCTAHWNGAPAGSLRGPAGGPGALERLARLDRRAVQWSVRCTRTAPRIGSARVNARAVGRRGGRNPAARCLAGVPGWRVRAGHRAGHAAARSNRRVAQNGSARAPAVQVEHSDRSVGRSGAPAGRIAGAFGRRHGCSPDRGRRCFGYGDHRLPSEGAHAVYRRSCVRGLVQPPYVLGVAPHAPCPGAAPVGS